MKSYMAVFFLLLAVNLFGQVCQPDGNKRHAQLNTTEEPYRYIVLLSIERPGGSFQGTGVLIAPRAILTAAHNIHRFNMFSYVKNITIVPGASYSAENKKPFGTYTYNKRNIQILTHPDYRGNSTRRSDFGVIILPNDSIYRKVGGFLNIAVYDSLKNISDSINISGYPGDKLYGTQWSESSNKFEEKNGMLIYDLFTHTGISGAPVFFKDRVNSNYAVIGIHNTGSLNGAGGCNAATKIGADTFILINKWLQESR